MNRRGFLALLGVAPVAASIEVEAKPTVAVFKSEDVSYRLKPYLAGDTIVIRRPPAFKMSRLPRFRDAL